MVASLDGAIAVDGTSAGLGNATDRAILLTLRSVADMILVGSRTARQEAYRSPAAGQRIGVVTNTATMGTTTELFTSGAGFLIAPDQVVVPNGVDVLRSGQDQVDLVEAIGRLREIDAEVDLVQLEGGATLNGALFAADLVDEINLTMSPLVVGGSSPRLTTTSEEFARRFHLAHLLVDREGWVFGRWIRDRRCDH